MNGKTIIVTGGGSGIGKAMAKKFAEEGANVVISGRNADRLKSAKMEIETFEGQVLDFQMDVRIPENVKDMVATAKKTFGRIDALVNNAAGNFICASEELSVNGWNTVINIDLNGTWYCSQAVAKDWIQNNQNGSILNIVATMAWGAAPGNVHACSAKAGILAMTRTLAVEWGSKYGIRANCIAPGPIENTEGVTRLIDSKDGYQKAINQVPLKRLGKVEEIAKLAHFLLSPDAEYINGECITMDGGRWLNNHDLREI
ncbi:NAD(P)-dependent dehydrogenase (short-subunit alcohol dehydrogenase family) [Neobacillus niacini]|uniref:2,4-dienoyl-CoA reductase n=1 Tax=Neobacillus niacini TaxID=86668 RepID=UPI00278720A8|nr:2,4-dienoyl-CoA reductase [Neobacillus niacini]MDQ1002898.1 NAD(P)-dependent dehydrogenase (short-subunit alcohol dehydrogenase family) [Neobacillus niacini]